MTFADLPAVNASLNALSTVFIAAGWVFITRERKRSHIACMVAAIATSSAFLTCYLIYHFSLKGLSVHFTYPGPVRYVYFVLLITHIMLAFSTVPLVAASVIPALRQRWGAHRAVSRWTMPIWLYVSVTGVIVYFMLYQWFPSTEIPSKLGRPIPAGTVEKQEAAAAARGS